MQKMLDDESAATKARYADKDADAMIRAGLRGLSSRKPGMQGFFEGVTEGLDYHDKVSELESSANRANRQANMDLIKSRMSDEKGDRDAAQRYFDSYQKNKRDAETYEMQRSNILINAQKGLVDVEGKRERAGMGLQMGMDRLGAQMENNSLRNQLGLMKLMGGNQPKALTVNEKLALEKRVGEVFGNPTSPEFQKYVGANYTGGPEQLALDLKNKRVTLDKLQPIIDRAKKRYVENLVGGTRSSSGPTPYDQAAADLGQ
jgi:energy-coupling factor transporter ATP-binding protein EcfA2